MMLASLDGTKRYSERMVKNNQVKPCFYRDVFGLRLSSIGIGTSLGDNSERKDADYQQAICKAVELGCNFIDTAINYRNQRSEKTIGKSIKVLLRSKTILRDEIFITSKAGFLPNEDLDLFKSLDHLYSSNDIIGNNHSIHPTALNFCFNKSLTNLGLDSIDVYYLHNPEVQIRYVSTKVLYNRLAEAFEYLESLAVTKKIGAYGIASWDGFTSCLDLLTLIKIAQGIGGSKNNFKYIQLPFNLFMKDSLLKNSQIINGQTYSVISCANYFNIKVIASAPLMHGSIIGSLAEKTRSLCPNLSTDAQKSIQIVRSTPGITATIVGMSQIDHIEENLKIAFVSPIGE